MQYIYLSTADTTLLVIIAVLMGLFFALGAVALVLIIRVLSSLRRMAESAENVVDSVEAAAETLRDSSGLSSLYRLLKNIGDLTRKRK